MICGGGNASITIVPTLASCKYPHLQHTGRDSSSHHCIMQVLALGSGMLGRTYEREICSAARALEIVGERWSLLILRNAAFAGMTRFTEFQKSLDMAPNILAARLEHFVESGLMTMSGSEGRETYHLSKKGLDFKPVIMALTEWGDRWAAPDGAPIVFEHEGCGGRVRHEWYCARCTERVLPQDVAARKTAVMRRLQEQRKALAVRQGRARQGA